MGARIPRALGVPACVLLLLYLAPGPLLGDYIKEFECGGFSVHKFRNTLVKSENFKRGEPGDEDFAYKKTEHYCKLIEDKNKRQGITKITYRDFYPVKRRTYIWGQYHNDRRRGIWVVTDAHGGEVLDECLYDKRGKLKKGDEWWCDR